MMIKTKKHKYNIDMWKLWIRLFKLRIWIFLFWYVYSQLPPTSLSWLPFLPMIVITRMETTKMTTPMIIKNKNTTTTLTHKQWNQGFLAIIMACIWSDMSSLISNLSFSQCNYCFISLFHDSIYINFECHFPDF